MDTWKVFLLAVEEGVACELGVKCNVIIGREKKQLQGILTLYNIPCIHILPS